MNRRNFLTSLLAVVPAVALGLRKQPAPVVVVHKPVAKGPTLGAWMAGTSSYSQGEMPGDKHFGIHTVIHDDGTRTVRSLTFNEHKKMMDDFMAGKSRGQFHFKETA